MPPSSSMAADFSTRAMFRKVRKPTPQPFLRMLVRWLALMCSMAATSSMRIGLL